MHVPCCSKGTACKSNCYLLDFYSMLKILRFRRYKLFNELNSKQNGTNSWRKRRDNLGIGPLNYVFVGNSGAIWRPAMIGSIVKDVININNIPEPSNYASYSVRIGATTLANLQGINLLKLMRYVVWSIKSLPHVSGRYIMFNYLELGAIPFEMIHGVNIPGKQNVDRSNGKWKVFNLWNNKQAVKLFTKQL